MNKELEFNFPNDGTITEISNTEENFYSVYWDAKRKKWNVSSVDNGTAGLYHRFLVVSDVNSADALEVISCNDLESGHEILYDSGVVKGVTDW